MKYLKTTRSGDLCGISMLAWVKPSVWFWIKFSEHQLLLFLLFLYNDVCLQYFHNLSWTSQLVSKFRLFSGSLLVTESPCYIAGCESRQHLQASDIFRETPRECILFKQMVVLSCQWAHRVYRIIETYF